MLTTLMSHEAVTGTHTPDTSPLLILSLAILIFLIIRNLIGHAFSVARLFLTPIIIGFLGIVAVLPVLPRTHFHTIDYIIGGLDVLVSLIVGGVRGITVKLYKQHGVLYYRYTMLTALLWCISIGMRIGLSAIAATHGATTLIVSADILLMLASSVFFQNLVVLWRRKQYAIEA